MTDCVPRDKVLAVLELECASCPGSEIGESFCKQCAIYRKKIAVKAITPSGTLKEAHWIDNGRDKSPTCSNCGSGCLLNYESDFHKSDYCPHCGAFMKGATL